MTALYKTLMIGCITAAVLSVGWNLLPTYDQGRITKAEVLELSGASRESRFLEQVESGHMSDGGLLAWGQSTVKGITVRGHMDNWDEYSDRFERDLPPCPASISYERDGNGWIYWFAEGEKDYYTPGQVRECVAQHINSAAHSYVSNRLDLDSYDFGGADAARTETRESWDSEQQSEAPQG